MIDTGSMYRAVTLAIIQHQIDINNSAAIEALLPSIHISWQAVNHHQHTFLNGIDVEGYWCSGVAPRAFKDKFQTCTKTGWQKTTEAP